LPIHLIPLQMETRSKTGCTYIASQGSAQDIVKSWKVFVFDFILPKMYNSVRPFSHWGDATAIRSRRKSTTLNAWRVVIASWSRWWEKRHYELKVRPVGDCKVISFLIESQSQRLSGRTALRHRNVCAYISKFRKIYRNFRSMSEGD
jgi:hypothetical protein